MTTTFNRDILKLDYVGANGKVYTMESILEAVCDFIGQPFEIYHRSDSGSIYAKLLNTRKNDGYVLLRVSDHDILNRGHLASLGGADYEILLRAHEDLFDLEDKAIELLEDIEDYAI